MTWNILHGCQNLYIYPWTAIFLSPSRLLGCGNLIFPFRGRPDCACVSKRVWRALVSYLPDLKTLHGCQNQYIYPRKAVFPLYQGNTDVEIVLFLPPGDSLFVSVWQTFPRAWPRPAPSRQTLEDVMATTWPWGKQCRRPQTNARRSVGATGDTALPPASAWGRCWRRSFVIVLCFSGGKISWRGAPPHINAAIWLADFGFP